MQFQDYLVVPIGFDWSNSICVLSPMNCTIFRQCPLFTSLDLSILICLLPDKAQAVMYLTVLPLEIFHLILGYLCAHCRENKQPLYRRGII